MAEVNLAAGAQREVQIEQGGFGRGMEFGGAVQDLFFPDFDGHFAGGAQGFAVLALDFHLENLVGVLPGVDLFVDHEGDEASLEGSEAPLDLALGLGRRSHDVGDMQRAQRALEFALRVAVVVARTRAKEAQPVGVDDLWQAVALEGFTEVLEVVPSGVALDEAAGHAEAGTIVGGEQQGLLGDGRPPLVDRAVMLPEFTDMSMAEAPVGAGFALGLWDEVGEVGFDVILHCRTGSLEVVQPLHFIGNELEIGRALQRQEALEELDDFGGPCLTMIATAGCWLIG